ncbi:MAG TPA: hypothetical protein VMX13_06715 [Sedimentisphaerales bacterium]|nr:hypothetical protein [Sedimentisphaerales bacterium]
MSKSKEYVRICVFSVLGVLITATCATVLLDASAASAATLGRVLTAAQLEVTFGDACHCKKSYSCQQGFKSGASNCSKCSAGSRYFRCCQDLADTGDTCELSSDNGCSGNLVYGPVDGSYSTCTSCSIDSETEGTACTKKKATNASSVCD